MAKDIREDVAKGVAIMKNSFGIKPAFAVVMAGKRPDTLSYVKQKQKAADEIGIGFHLEAFEDDVTEEELIRTVDQLSADPSIHGIIIQLPLPPQISEMKIQSLVPAEKDIDGFNPLNMGMLAMRRREPKFIPCTPLACLHILDHNQIDITGKRVFVLGRSNVVGLPLSLLLMKRNATVTICHRFTENEESIIKEADVVIVAVGIAGLLRKEWIKEGAVVIDVGITQIEDSSKKSGVRLVGDVHPDVSSKASLVTPVPGGVGPLTVAMLLKNVLRSAQLSSGMTPS